MSGPIKIAEGLAWSLESSKYHMARQAHRDEITGDIGGLIDTLAASVYRENEDYIEQLRLWRIWSEGEARKMMLD